MSKRCPECGSTKLVYIDETREIICRDCGLVVEVKPEPEKPWSVS